MEEKSITTIGNYEAVELFRKVPEGVLFKAKEKNSGTQVLLKLYYPSLIWSDEILNEFFNLISYLRFIEHDNLLPILDVGKHEGLPYVVFPGDSTTILSDRPAPAASRKELLAFFYKIADALDFLHKQEILHGILNTGNIILSATGEPKLFDYGLSGVFKKLLLENMEDGFDNLSVSDLRCTSPEQILGRNPTRSSDIYSFGVAFYFYAMGEFPFNGKSDPETAVSLLDSETVKVGNIPEYASMDILRFIQKCIQLEPNARFAGFSQILNILDRLQAGKRVRLRSRKRFEVQRQFPRRLAWYAIGMLGLIGLFFIFYFYPRNLEKPPPASPTPATTSQSISAPPAVQATETAITSDHGQATQEASGAEATSTAPSPIQAIYKPAMEGESPDIPTQVISLSNIGEIREIARLGYGKPEEAAVSPNGITAAFATSAGVIIFTGSQFLKWIDPQDWATSVRFSTNGDILAVGVDSGEIQLWDWKNEALITTLTGHKDKITKIIFSSSDRLLYSASHDQHVIVWDLNQQSISKDITAHSAPVNDIAVSSDGRTLVSCSDDQLFRIWDIASGNKIYEERFDGKPKAVAISSDDAYFAVGGDTGFIRQWNLIDSQSLRNALPQLRTDAIPVQKRIWSLDYINNDTQLLAGIDDGGAKTYNAAQQEYEGVSLTFVIPLPHKDLVDIFGPKFEFGSHSTLYGTNIISLRWDGRVAAQQTELLQPMYDIMDRLDFSPDGTILASGGRRGTTNVWDLNTNQVMYRSLYALPFGDPIAPDGSSVVIRVSETARITITGEHIIQETYRQIPLSGASVVGELSDAISNSMVGYARDGSVFVSGSLTQSKTWDYTSGLETFSRGSERIAGCFVTTSNNNGETLQLNSAAGTLPAQNEQQNEQIKYICGNSVGKNLPVFSGDLTLLAYVNSNGLVEGYDTSSKQQRWRYQPVSRITALAVSPDGTIIAIGHETGKMVFINGQNGEVLTEITGNFAAIRAIEFSEDGKRLATTGDDGTTRLFGMADTR